MATTDIVTINQLKTIEKDMKRFLMSYKFGLEEIKTKVNILNVYKTYWDNDNVINDKKIKSITFFDTEIKMPINKKLN